MTQKKLTQIKKILSDLENKKVSVEGALLKISNLK
jgi:hypothetical protein